MHTGSSSLFQQLTTNLWDTAFQGSISARQQIKFILIDAIIHITMHVLAHRPFQHLDPAEVEERATASIETMIDRGIGLLWRHAERDAMKSDDEFTCVWWFLRATVFNAARRANQVTQRRRTYVDHDAAVSATTTRMLQPDDAVDTLTELDLEARFLRAFRGLPDAQRMLLTMRFVNHMSFNEIALATNVSAGTLRGQVHRALHDLRRSLDCDSDT